MGSESLDKGAIIPKEYNGLGSCGEPRSLTFGIDIENRKRKTTGIIISYSESRMIFL